MKYLSWDRNRILKNYCQCKNNSIFIYNDVSPIGVITYIVCTLFLIGFFFIPFLLELGLKNIGIQAIGLLFIFILRLICQKSNKVLSVVRFNCFNIVFIISIVVAFLSYFIFYKAFLILQVLLQFIVFFLISLYYGSLIRAFWILTWGVFSYLIIIAPLWLEFQNNNHFDAQLPLFLNFLNIIFAIFLSKIEHLPKNLTSWKLIFVPFGFIVGALLLLLFNTLVLETYEAIRSVLNWIAFLGGIGALLSTVLLIMCIIFVQHNLLTKIIDSKKFK